MYLVIRGLVVFLYLFVNKSTCVPFCGFSDGIIICIVINMFIMCMLCFLIAWIINYSFHPEKTLPWSILSW